MVLVNWLNKNGQADFQECVNDDDVRQCVEQIVIPGGGVNSSIRIHKVSETLELDEGFNLVKGRECVPDSFNLQY